MNDAFPPTFGQPCVFNPMETGTAIEDIWPSLYVGADRLPEIRRKAASCDWAARALDRMRAEATEVIGTPATFVTELHGEPIGNAGRCRLFTDGGHYLQFDPVAHAPLWDPYRSEYVPPHDGLLEGWVVLQHERMRRLITSIARLGRLDDNSACLHWACDGLLALADCYEQYGRTQAPDTTPYRYFYGGLYEAQCQLQVIQTLDLLDGANGVETSVIARVKQSIIRPGCEALRRWMDRMIVHNMSVWAMAALAEASRVLDEPEWLETALHSERCGLSSLLTRGLPDAAATGKPDGFWFEHSPFYGCFYVVTAITSLLRAADAAGQLTDDLRRRYASLFDAMPHLADAQLRLVSISDRAGPETIRLTQTRHLYEYAAGQIDPAHAPLLALLYDRCGAARDSWAALAYGPDVLPDGRAPETLTASAILPSAGLVTFRAATPASGQATLWFQNLRRYPGGAQGHHHMDKLSYSLHVDGAVVTSDLGWPGCESKASGRGAYLSGSLSHNTLLVNEFDQGPVQTLAFEGHLDAAVPWARGQIRGNSDEPLWDIFAKHHGGHLQKGLYDGVTLTRTIWFAYPRIVILDEFLSDEEQRFGAVFHARGAMVARADCDAPPLELPPLPTAGAWSFFTGRTRADGVVRFVADWRVRADIYLRSTTRSDGSFDAHWGRTPDNPDDITRGSIYLRAPGSSRRFATCLEIHPGTPTVADIRAMSDSSVCLRHYDGSELQLST